MEGKNEDKDKEQGVKKQGEVEVKLELFINNAFESIHGPIDSSKSPREIEKLKKS